jgi:hypothetical protein
MSTKFLGVFDEMSTNFLGDPDVGELLAGVVDVALHVFADDGLLVVAGDVVPLDAVAVEVVEHGHARLAALAVVGLADAGASGVRPVVELVRVGGSELDLVGGPDEGGETNL